MKRSCRDCGRRINEDPEDTAPNLCSGCYRDRLDRITPLFLAKMEEMLAESNDITPLVAWLGHALEEIGGHTRADARRHAHALGVQAVMMSQGRMN